MRVVGASPLSTLATAVTAASIFGSTIAPFPGMPFQQFNTATDIPKSKFQNNDVLYGKVVKVVDGDTIRVRHYPLYPTSFRASYEGLLSENTISVRIYGVDAPEIAKFGNPSMPMAEEAKDFAQSLVGDKIVRVKLLRRDQYNRAVAKVTTKGFIPFTKADLSISLAKRGLATLYTGGGAEYDGKREVLEKKIEAAKKRKKGVWSNGSQIVTPAEYKKNVRKKNTAKVTTNYAAQAY